MPHYLSGKSKSDGYARVRLQGLKWNGKVVEVKFGIW